MSGRRTSTPARSAKRAVSRPANRVTPARSTPSVRTASDEQLLRGKYRELIRQHLDRLLDKLFTDVTGLHFHIAWAPALPKQWDAQTLPTGCSACCRISGSPLRPGCKDCGPRQLARALKADGDGHHFTCRLGIRNHWLAIRIRGETVGVAYLQALDGNHGQPPARKNLARDRTKVLSRVKFIRAARLLQFIIQHGQTSSLADLRKAELTKAQQALRVFENFQTRLRKKLNGVLPALRTTPPVPQPQSRTERIVRAVLDRIQQDYAQPLTLLKCAGDLRMNAAYLSHLFSRAVGLPFKTCLTEVRMEKARELLGDPAKNISHVASAVGYASANRFRIAFKNVTGISPRMWRETLQMNPPSSSSSSS